MSDTDEIRDPLLEEFEKLEQRARDKALATRRAACPHERTAQLNEMTGRRRLVCLDCGLWLPLLADNLFEPIDPSGPGVETMEIDRDGD